MTDQFDFRVLQTSGHQRPLRRQTLDGRKRFVRSLTQTLPGVRFGRGNGRSLRSNPPNRTKPTKWQDHQDGQKQCWATGFDHTPRPVRQLSASNRTQAADSAHAPVGAESAIALQYGQQLCRHQSAPPGDVWLLPVRQRVNGHYRQSDSRHAGVAEPAFRKSVCAGVARWHLLQSTPRGQSGHACVVQRDRLDTVRQKTSAWVSIPPRASRPSSG